MEKGQAGMGMRGTKDGPELMAEAVGIAAEAIGARLATVARAFEAASMAVADSAGALQRDPVEQWRGKAAQAYRLEVERHVNDLSELSYQYQETAQAIRLAAQQIGAQLYLGSTVALASSLVGLIGDIVPSSVLGTLRGGIGLGPV